MALIQGAESGVVDVDSRQLPLARLALAVLAQVHRNSVVVPFSTGLGGGGREVEGVRLPQLLIEEISRTTTVREKGKK